ncbi:hypothetical protein Tco_1245365 [Tanacetum coccineum]
MQRGMIFSKGWTSIYRQENPTWRAFGGVEDEEVIVGEGVVVISSSLDMLTNSCLGGIMVSLIFLEWLDEEALVEFMVEWCEEDEDDDRSGEDDLFN